MDIEGAEMAALLGMHNLLMKNRQLKMVTEFNPSFLKDAGYSAEAFLGKLGEYGFRIYDINSKKNLIEPCDASSLLREENASRTINLLCVRADA